MTLHPSEALFHNHRPLPAIPVCEHFAGTEKTMGKAIALQESMGPVFDVTLDLEDGAPRGKEREYSDYAAGLVAGARSPWNRIAIRIHDPASPFWQEDLETAVRLAGERLPYITIPKAETHGQVRMVLEKLEELELQYGIAQPIPLHILVESPSTLRDVYQIAGESRVQTLDFGLMDYVSSFYGAIPSSALRSPGQFENPLIVQARVDIVLAALSTGTIPSQNVTIDLSSGGRAYEDARRAKMEFGFLRMWSIHPSQIEPILKAMLPEHDEMERAARLLLEASRNQWGPIRFEEELHDRASYRIFWTLLERGVRGGREIPDMVSHWFRT